MILPVPAIINHKARYGEKQQEIDSRKIPEYPGLMKAEGAKNDVGKLRYDLIPVEPLRRLAEVYTIGCRKYADRNWEKGIQYGRIIGALMRHFEAWRDGEKLDPENGQHHLASVAWCAFALMEYENTHPELDDRPRKG